MEEYKVLFHISEQENWPKTLRNIENFFKDVDEKTAQVEVVANASAVGAYFTDSNNAENQILLNQMLALANRGVQFVACRNALAAQGLDEKLLPSFVQGVSGGITEIVFRQNQGYVYIKP